MRLLFILLISILIISTSLSMSIIDKNCYKNCIGKENVSKKRQSSILKGKCRLECIKKQKIRINQRKSLSEVSDSNKVYKK